MVDNKTALSICCPFYGSLGSTNMSCEFLGQEYGIVMRFKNSTQKHQVLAKWCFGRNTHKECPIAAANYKYYEAKNEVSMSLGGNQ